jgi:hypothetical protein
VVGLSDGTRIRPSRRCEPSQPCGKFEHPKRQPAPIRQPRKATCIFQGGERQKLRAIGGFAVRSPTLPGIT